MDIVFEEDVGFLTAVKSLMSTTKRPIILTSNGELQSSPEIHLKQNKVDLLYEFIQTKI